MRKTKRLFPQFTFYDRTGIQKLLEREAEKGWLLEHIGYFGWKMKRIEPKKIHYAVTYFPGTSNFEPHPPEDQLRLQEFCAHAGWVLAGSTAQLQVFYNEAENPVPIETDAAIELQNIEASARRTHLPVYWMLLAVAVLQLWLHGSNLADDLVGTLASNTLLFTGIVSVLLLVMCLLELVGYYVWHAKAKKAVQTDGSFVPTVGFRNIELTLCALIGLTFLALVASLERVYGVIMLVTLCGYLAIQFGVLGINKALKKLDFHAQDNKIVTIVASVVLSVLFIWVVIPILVEEVREAFPKENQSTYTYQGHEFVSYKDELPLTLADLTGNESEKYSCYFRGNESLIASQYNGSQHPHFDVLDQPELYYVIYEVKLPFLFEAALHEQLHHYDDWEGMDISYRESDADPWKADRAFTEYSGDEPQNEFLLCYGNRIIYFRCDFVLDENQMAIVAEKIGK